MPDLVTPDFHQTLTVLVRSLERTKRYRDTISDLGGYEVVVGQLLGFIDEDIITLQGSKITTAKYKSSLIPHRHKQGLTNFSSD